MSPYCKTPSLRQTTRAFRPRVSPQINRRCRRQRKIPPEIQQKKYLKSHITSFSFPFASLKKSIDTTNRRTIHSSGGFFSMRQYILNIPSDKNTVPCTRLPKKLHSFKHLPSRCIMRSDRSLLFYQKLLFQKRTRTFVCQNPVKRILLGTD